MQNVVAASGVRDGAKVCKWHLAVEVTGKTREDFEDPEGYPTLDRKIAAALGKIFKGELGRKVNNLERTLLAREQRMLSGRERLFLMYQFFRTNKNLGLIHSVFDLGKVAWLGDNHIERFRNNWDSMLAGIATDMDDKLLAEAFLQQLDKSTELRDEV